MTATRGPSPTHHYRHRYPPRTHQTLPSAPPRTTSPKLWNACLRGDMPAEALGQRDREDLVWHLHQLGWTDTEIAAHTRMTTYTTARIRTRLGLEPNEHRRSADAA